MKVEVTDDKRGTVVCTECGSRDARWASRLAGDDIEEHLSDFVVWCPQCAKLREVMAWVLTSDDVLMWSGDRDWKDREVWYHWGEDDWDVACPDDVMVHLGCRETSEWVSRFGEREHGVLWKCIVDRGVLDRMRMGKDYCGDVWPADRSEMGYVNMFEAPGRVSLFLRKGDIAGISRAF